MAELKTKQTGASVSAFLNQIADPQRRADARAIVSMMRDATKQRPAMWGTTIVGFGRLHYKYASGREGDWFRAGFSPRKDGFSLYVCGGFARHQKLLAKLGKFKTGAGCLYVKRLEDVDARVLKQLIARTARAPSGNQLFS